MAQAQPGHKDQETTSTVDSNKDSSSSSINKNTTNLSFKFNAHAPEFVPRSQTQIADLSGYYYPYFQLCGGTATSEWLFVGDKDPAFFFQCAAAMAPANCSKNVLTEDLQQKIAKQVIISGDGKKVKRRNAYSEKDKEELQSRMVVVENLPEDHSHQNLEKIFSVVGSVKNIRICHPQEPNSSRSPRCDLLIGNKLHAIIEYETPEIAEAAVEKLNDERDWRKGLRVRLLHKCSPKSVSKNKRSDFDVVLDDEEGQDFGDDIQSNNIEIGVESSFEDTQVFLKKVSSRGRGKLRGRSLSHNGRTVVLGSPQPVLCDGSANKPNFRGPRMPDGTRGFTMGRGKTSTPP